MEISAIHRARVRAAVRAASWHGLGSLVLALLSALVVFGVWFPYPYRELAGGRDLFLLVVAVDVVCGPLLTAVIFNPAKPRRELVLDLGLVVLIQLVALGYGVYTMAQARPVYLVFEVDRLRVVTAADVVSEELRPEQDGLQRLPWTGPRLIGVRDPRNSDERLKSIELSIQGQEPSVRPDWWQPYELSRPQVQERAHPVQALRDKHPQAKALIDAAVAQSGQDEQSLRWLPVTSFKSYDWVAFLDAQTQQVRSFAPVDGF